VRMGSGWNWLRIMPVGGLWYLWCWIVGFTTRERVLNYQKC